MSFEEEPTVWRIQKERRTTGREEATGREEPTDGGWRRTEEELELTEEEDG